MDKDLILSEEKGERKLMVHESGQIQVHGSRLRVHDYGRKEV